MSEDKNKQPRHIYRNLIYLTQMGLTLAIPPIISLWGASWLQQRFGLGNWIMIAGIILGIGGMISNLLDYIRMFSRRAKAETKERISFNKRW